MRSPFLNGSGMRASALRISISLPPAGTWMNVHAVLEPLLHTCTWRCGPAPSSGKPRSELPPPVKNASLNGTKLLANGCASPMRMLPAHTMLSHLVL